MGARAPSFTLLPAPAAGVPTNAALVATSHSRWAVRVEGAPVEVTTEARHSPDGTTEYTLVRPARAPSLLSRLTAPVAEPPPPLWPAGQTLTLVSWPDGLAPPGAPAAEPAWSQRTPFTVAPGPCGSPPTCAWSGPIAMTAHHPIFPPGFAGPTNAPVSPSNARSFALPAITSEAGYLVHAAIRLAWMGGGYTVEGMLVADGRARGTDVNVPMNARGEVASDARIVGWTLTDLCGQQATFGEMT
jgi:hypothetical protein